MEMLSRGCGKDVGGYLYGVGRLYRGCVRLFVGEVVWRVWGCCLECVGRLSRGCGKDAWRMWGKGVYRCRMSALCVGRLCGGMWRVWQGCLEGVRSLSRRYGESAWRIWEGCLESVGKLSRGYGKSVYSV